jgi:two-component system, LytTR family, response regulator
MRERPIKTIIIEDDAEALYLLTSLVNSTGLAEVCGSTTNPAVALELVKSTSPEIIFLDIRMPNISGLDIAREIKQTDGKKPYIVFTTASDDYALEAFEYSAFDYLLKPFSAQRLRDTLKRYRETLSYSAERSTRKSSENEGVLIFKNTNGAVFIDPSNVIMITADGNYSTFFSVPGRTDTVTILLGTIENQLPANRFFRTSRSAIINVSFLTKIDSKQGQCILSKNGKEYRCEISKDRIKLLMEFMKNSGQDI